MNTNQHDTGWTDVRIELLKKLRLDGLSASQVGAQMGVSRCAVLGKLHRLGGYKRSMHPSRPRGPRGPRKSRSKGNTHMLMRPPKPVPVIKLRPREVPPPDALMLPLMALNANDCHWPIGHPGEPDFGFCAAPSLAGYSYCEHHSALAYQPVTSRAERDAKRQAERVVAA